MKFSKCQRLVLPLHVILPSALCLFMIAFWSLPALAQEVPNPLARHLGDNPTSLVQGRWNGANLENRSNCSAPQFNGFHGTYAEYGVDFDRAASVMTSNVLRFSGCGPRAERTSRVSDAGPQSAATAKLDVMCQDVVP